MTKKLKRIVEFVVQKVREEKRRKRKPKMYRDDLAGAEGFLEPTPVMNFAKPTKPVSPALSMTRPADEDEDDEDRGHDEDEDGEFLRPAPDLNSRFKNPMRRRDRS
jgi:hypothetical protein